MQEKMAIYHPSSSYYFRSDRRQSLVDYLKYIKSLKSCSTSNGFCGARNKGSSGGQAWLTRVLLTIFLLQTYSDNFGPVWAQSSVILRNLHSSSSSPSSVKRDLSFRQPESRSRACQVSNGESVAIVEIEESRGSDMSQVTNPPVLPISGSIDEIELRIVSETHKYFEIEDKTLRLTRPLDRDAVLKQNSSSIQQQPISSIYLQVSCTEKQETTSTYAGNEARGRAEPRKVIIPLLVKVLDLNDNAPKFSSPVYSVRVNELTPVGSIIFDDIQAIDLDSANNGLVEYFLASSPPAVNQPVTPPILGPKLVSRAQSTQKVPILTTIVSSSISPTTFIPKQTTSQQHVPLQNAETTRNFLFSSSSSPASEASTRTTLPVVASTREPTFNLNSEPIENGPIGEGEGDEDNDEALLASLNSTDSETDSDPNPESMIVSMLPFSSSRQVKRFTRDTGRSMASNRLRSRQVNPSEAGEEQSSRKPGAELWTNLMSGPSEELSIGQMTSPSMQLDADSESSLDFFSLELAPQSNRPIIRLKQALDFESKRVHQLYVVATDKATNRQDRMSSWASLVVRVLDGDDQGPVFVLDQTGCATGSLPQTTASSGPQAMQQFSSGSERPMLSKRVLAIGDRPVRHNLPKGFKVTDENFQFGDSASMQLGPNEDSSGEEDDAEFRAGGQVVPSDAARGRKILFASPAFATHGSYSNSEGSVTQAPVRAAQLGFGCLPFNGTASGQAEYFGTVMSGESDYLVRVTPQAIRARDRDELNAPIRYSFINGTPANYSAYFQINPLDATITQVAPIERQQPDRLVMWVQAQEQSGNRLASMAKLTIDVVASDKSPPVLVPNSYSGFVAENSAIGTSVVTDSSPDAKPLIISVIDASDGRNPSAGAGSSRQYAYEFETTSDAFKVNKDGLVYVNKWPLDRDQPDGQPVHVFQVTARQPGLLSSHSVSSPVIINVTLLDLNDNIPVIANNSLLPIQMSAGGSNGSIKQISTIKALDADEGDNAKAHFSLLHVSNGGRDRFRLNRDSGELEALGKFQNGEQFSLTLQVSDSLGRSSQAILELQTVAGPNQAAPQFLPAEPNESLAGQAESLLASRTSQTGKQGYYVEISEGVAPQSAFFQVRAVDPENDPISYSIIEGNVNDDFYINSKSGTLYVANKLDREEVSAYRLIVQARDSGGLGNSWPITIQIIDINDHNPVFSSANYTFSLGEGSASVGQIFGTLQASDADSGDNGLISYRLEPSFATSHQTGRPLFSINSSTGELKLEEALDYEETKSYALVVSAIDKGETPRSSTASVLVRVLDVEDEPPYFERYHMEARVPENIAGHRVAQVRAHDLDSQQQVTYVIKSGDTSLFSVDQRTGVVSTIGRGLDFEQTRQHTLIIGTIENQEPDLLEAVNQLSNSLSSGLALRRSPICRLDITVTDLNDNVPQFGGQPIPIRVQGSAALGSLVGQLVAKDADGSSPNNEIRYELVLPPQQADARNLSGYPSEPIKTISQPPLIAGFTSEQCGKLFLVDQSTGWISVKSDLKRDALSECILVVRARDLGLEPSSLSSESQLTVFIDHMAEISASSMVGFADSQYTVELEENARPNSLVKALPIMNKPKINFPMSCEIVNGNELAKFYAKIDDQQSECELRTSRDPLSARSGLDYELRQRYTLTLRLNTIGSLNSHTLAQVQVNLLDINDNRPIFQPVARYSHLTDNKFLAAIASDAPSESQVFQLRATDLDSANSNGLISYELLNSKELEDRFKIDPKDGMIRTSKPMEDIPIGRLPLRLRVLARDNPELVGQSLESMAEVVVNLIEDRHRLVLVLKDASAANVLERKEEILDIIQERTGLIPGLEKTESLKILRNGTLESDVSGTDFWFHLIEPGTFRIVLSEDVRVKNVLALDQRGHNSLLDVLGQTLGFTKARFRLSYSMNNPQIRTAGVLSSRTNQNSEGETIGSSLIWFASGIAIISAIVVVYQCGTWSSGSSSRPGLKEKKLSAELRNQAAFYNQQFGYPSKQANNLVAAPLVDPMLANGYAMRSAYSTIASHRPLAGPNQMRKQAPIQPSSTNEPKSLYQLDPAGNTLSKEYETQMLKMSVLFDDVNSLDEQNLHRC